MPYADDAKLVLARARLTCSTRCSPNPWFLAQKQSMSCSNIAHHVCRRLSNGDAVLLMVHLFTLNSFKHAGDVSHLNMRSQPY